MAQHNQQGGGWGGQPAPQQGGGWGQPAPQQGGFPGGSGGWGGQPAPQQGGFPGGGGWSQPTPQQTSGGWGGQPAPQQGGFSGGGGGGGWGQPTLQQTSGGWGGQPAPQQFGSGGWGQPAPQQGGFPGGGWGQPTPQQTSGGWGGQPAPQQQQGGWGQSAPQQQQAPHQAAGGPASIPKAKVELMSERRGSPFNSPGFGNNRLQIFPVDQSADPQGFITADMSGYVHEWDRDTWQELSRWQCKEGAVNSYGATYHNGVIAAVCNVFSERYIEWARLSDKTGKRHKISAPGLNGEMRAVGLMLTAPQAVVGTWGHHGLVDLETGRVVRNLKNDQAIPNLIKPVPNHPGLCLVQDSDGMITCWDLNSNGTTPIKKFLGLGAYPHELQFNPANPTELIGGSNGKPIKIWDFASGRAKYTIEVAKSLGGSTFTYALYGNVVLQCDRSVASLTLVEAPAEELNVFSPLGSTDTIQTCYLTPTAAIFVGNGTVAEWTFGK